jgi:type IV pilus assembly protein PilM
VPSLATSNIVDAPAVSAVATEALDAVAARSRDVIVVIPDLAVRIMLLDFEELPATPPEAEGIVRLRLKKALPFDPEEARISFHVQRRSAGVKALVCAAMRSVVEEYERLFTASGYLPGIVLPSSLAALGLVDASRPTLVLNLGERRSSVTVVDRSEVQLFRNLDIGASSEPERIMDQIHPSLVFFQDEFGTPVEHVLIGGGVSAAALAPHFQEHHVKVEQLLSSKYLATNPPAGGAQQLAAVAGALIA